MSGKASRSSSTSSGEYATDSSSSSSLLAATTFRLLHLSEDGILEILYRCNFGQISSFFFHVYTNWRNHHTQYWAKAKIKSRDDFVTLTLTDIYKYPRIRAEYFKTNGKAKIHFEVQTEDAVDRLSKCWSLYNLKRHLLTHPKLHVLREEIDVNRKYRRLVCLNWNGF